MNEGQIRARLRASPESISPSLERYRKASRVEAGDTCLDWGLKVWQESPSQGEQPEQRLSQRKLSIMSSLWRVEVAGNKD